jgi:hypothetical protein
MLTPSKPDKVFLEAAPGFSSNALLLCAYGNPTIFAHPVENGASRKKTVPFRNACDWLGSENTRGKTAHFIMPQRVPSILASGPNSIFWFERIPQIAWKVTPTSVISKI